MVQTILDFLNMDGYGQFIWGSYGLSMAVLIVLLVQSKYFLKSSQTELELLQKNEPDNET